LGYYWGGRLADRYPAPTILAAVIALGGVSMLGLLTLSRLVLPELAPALGLATGPLLISLAFFFIPAFLLGIDSPFVIRLLSDGTHNEQGAIVGSVFFWSTIGSIVGSLSSGFWLIPYLGLIETLVAVSLTITLWSTALFFIVSNQAPTVPISLRSLRFIVVGASFAAVILAGFCLRIMSSAPGDLVYERDGLYSNIMIYDQTNASGTTYRFLKRDTNHSSAIALGSDEIVFSYAQLALLYPDFVPEAANYLVLGGGAFTMPRHLHNRHPDLIVDTVEIEPFLLPLAHEYFELPYAPQLRHHIMDARLFLSSTSTTYDVIFSDVMNTGFFIPPHLATKEFYTLINQRLAPNGIAFFNYVGSLDTRGRTLTGSTIATIKDTFPNYKVFALNDRGSYRLQNFVIAVRKEGVPFELTNTPITHRGSRATSTLADHLVRPGQFDFTDDVVFTDNQAPIEPLTFAQFRKYGY